MATPTPEASPTPEAPKATPAPEAPMATPTPEAPAPIPVPTAAPAPAPMVAPTVAPTPAPQAQVPTVETISPVQEEADETAHFEGAKAKALQDPHIQALQAKVDAASADELRSASRRYYRALFSKMRDIDPSITDRIDRAEAATLRRVQQDASQ